jgi:hypothetical protein
MEEYLTGGVNQILRTGDTVHRPVGSWTPLVHGLLRYVRAAGFTGAPVVHGIDAEGREELSFIAGEVSNYPLSPAAKSPEALTSAARLLRAYHDATTGYSGLESTGWMMPNRQPIEVVCHGDFAPYNTVLDGDRVIGVIDFDTAHPGPRVWDLAYAIYRWAPLAGPTNFDSFGTLTEQVSRARLFCDVYGLGDADRARLVDTVVDRLETLVGFMRARAADGNAAFQSHLDDGHDRLYLRDAEYVREHQNVIEAALFDD